MKNMASMRPLSFAVIAIVNFLIVVSAQLSSLPKGMAGEPGGTPRAGKSHLADKTSFVWLDGSWWRRRKPEEAIALTIFNVLNIILYR